MDIMPNKVEAMHRCLSVLGVDCYSKNTKLVIIAFS